MKARAAPARRTSSVAVEVLLAAALVVGAVRWWHRGVLLTEVAGVDLFRVDGRWWAVAILGVTVAGLLLIDAVRRLVTAPGGGPMIIDRSGTLGV